MRKTLFLIITCFLFSNCSHRIVRTGYEKNKSEYKDCDVVIKKNFANPDSITVKVGEIKLGESGFSVKCNEERAISILKNEACSIEADFILITEENRADAWSNCYRCRAEFYKYNPSAEIEKVGNDELYKPEYVKERVSNDRKRTTVIIVSTVVAVTAAMLMITFF